jgi:hypothetical protein
MVMIYAVGHISGAHLNPAVTFAFCLSRHFPWPRAIGYWSAQLLGALAAAAILRGSLGNIAHVGATLPSGSQGQSFLWELVMTFLLDVRDHGRRHRHPSGGRGRGDRDRRHRRSRRHVRRPRLGGVAEPGPLDRAGNTPTSTSDRSFAPERPATSGSRALVCRLLERRENGRRRDAWAHAAGGEP